MFRQWLMGLGYNFRENPRRAVHLVCAAFRRIVYARSPQNVLHPCATDIVQFVDGDGKPLSELFGVRSRRLRPAAPAHSYLSSLEDFEVRTRDQGVRVSRSVIMA